MSFPFVDVHAHFLPPFYREALREAGHLPGPDGYHKIPEWSAEEHLAFMKQNNIRKSYLSISSPGTFLTAPLPNNSQAALNAAKALTRKVNEYGSALKKQHPDHFGFFASLPLPDVDAALDEIAHIESANLLIDGVVLLSNAYGTYLGDAALSPIYARLNALRTVIFVHPTTPCTADHAASPPPSSADPTARVSLNTPLSNSYAGPMIEFLFDTTRALCDILLTQAAPQHPHIRWIIPHCGAVLPSVLDRVIRFSQAIPHKAGAARSTAPLSHDDVLGIIRRHFYFDLAGLPMGSQIHHVLRWVDHTRFLFGSDVPFTPYAFAGELADEVREELGRIFGVETGVHECMSICHGNAEALFGGLEA